MPGIVGLISRLPAPRCTALVQAMTGVMRHEPFQVSGQWADPELGVYAGWVAHEDTPAAEVHSRLPAEALSLIFTGECYADGTGPANAGMLSHYQCRGENGLAELNGLFAGLLVDGRQKRVLLFNDRYGVGRIYWHETAEAFYFASEAKALLRVLPELRSFDRDGVAQYLGVGSPLNGRTLFRDIHLLPGGACWTFQGGRRQRRSYFASTDWEQLPKLSAAEYTEQFIATFQKVLPRYFAAGSKVGIALTGGLDTRMFMAAHRHDPAAEISYTFTGPSGRTLDDRIAGRVAAACGLEHRLLRLGPDFFRDFGAHADRTVYVTDGTSGWLGAHEIYFHRQARSLATIRLTGNYGSEVLRGVSTFKPLGLAPAMLAPEIFPAVNAAGTALQRGRGAATLFAAFQEIPLNLYGNLAAGASQIRFRTPYLDNALVKLACQRPAELEKSSRPACRLVKATHRGLDRIPTDRGYISDRNDPEIWLRRIFAEVTFKLDYCSNAGLPRQLGVLDPVFKPVVGLLGVAGMHKFLKYSTWLREHWSALVNDRLAAIAHNEYGFWNVPGLQALTRLHLSGQKNYPGEISAVMNLEAVDRCLFRELPRGLDL